MKTWMLLWYFLGGAPPRNYDEDFFDWWTRVTFYVNEYCYASMDYRGDLDLPLLADTQWGDIGMSSDFCFLIYVIFLMLFKSTNMCV